jgi:glucose-6-phosphate 1-epimerase
MDLSTLNDRFALPGLATITAGHGGLARVSITTPQCEGELYLLGGQVTRWKPTGQQEVLWLSRHSVYKVGKAIRGGIPVCFPWFGAKADDPKAPSHGFVRTREWELESVASEADAVIATLLTRSDSSTQPLWPGDFELRLRARFGAQLTLELEVRNTGKQTLRAEEALHAYFTVADVRRVDISGLDATAYLDKTDSNTRKTQSGNVQIASETDRVYLDTTRNIEIIDPLLHRRIHIRKQNSLNTVVWNPWVEKAHALSDLGDDEWPTMVCVEPSNVGAHLIELSPGQQHTMTITIHLAE